jgi:excisionase family DNA binding protein
MTHETTILLSIDGAAEWLGMAPGALRGRIQRHEIPVVKIGRRVFFDRRQLDAWIQSNTQKPRRTKHN